MKKMTNNFELNEINGMNMSSEMNLNPTEDELMSIESCLEEDLMDSLAEEAEEADRDGYDLPAADRDKNVLRNSMQQYLFEIANVPLLTAEEENRLGQIIAGNGEHALEARNRLIKANLRLVIHEAKHYLGSGLPLEELNSYGVFGLIRAAEKFDYTKGYKFSTYAIWWIRQCITRGMKDEKSPVHIPVHVHTTLSKIRRAQRELTQLYDREPTAAEIADHLNLPLDKVESAMNSVFSVVYMDTPVGEEEETCLGDFIADERVGDFSDGLVWNDLRNAIEQALGGLDKKERFVIVHRFGLGDNEQMSLEKIGKMPEMGVSRERVRQIEDRALRKIRRSPVAMRMLAPFADMAS